MKIKITYAPVGHSFTDDKPYHVYGSTLGQFVFDEDCEACFLSELEYEVFTNED